jgi:hypothetical protein
VDEHRPKVAAHKRLLPWVLNISFTVQLSCLAFCVQFPIYHVLNAHKSHSQKDHKIGEKSAEKTRAKNPIKIEAKRRLQWARNGRSKSDLIPKLKVLGCFDSVTRLWSKLSEILEGFASKAKQI